MDYYARTTSCRSRETFHPCEHNGAMVGLLNARGASLFQRPAVLRGLAARVKRKGCSVLTASATPGGSPEQQEGASKLQQKSAAPPFEDSRARSDSSYSGLASSSGGARSSDHPNIQLIQEEVIREFEVRGGTGGGPSCMHVCMGAVGLVPKEVYV